VESEFPLQRNHGVFAPEKSVDITDSVKRIDSVKRQVVLMSTEGRGNINKTIDFDKIIGISGDLVDYLDEAPL